VARLCAVVSVRSRHFFLHSRFGIVLASDLFVARATRHFAGKAASVAFIIRFYHFISPRHRLSSLSGADIRWIWIDKSANVRFKIE
jgi:hypothetical protein